MQHVKTHSELSCHCHNYKVCLLALLGVLFTIHLTLLACSKNNIHHFFTIQYVLKHSDFHKEKSKHLGFAKETKSTQKLFDAIHLESSATYMEV